VGIHLDTAATDEQVYQWAKEIKGLKVTYGTDMFFLPAEAAAEQAKMMERLLPWFEPVEILRMATGTAGELLKLSGPMRDPYLEGSLGLVAEGNYADLLLVDGNPLEDLGAVTDADNIRISMKDASFLLLHLPTSVITPIQPGGSRAVIAEKGKDLQKRLARLHSH
jgi:imidazolonepropionase-like amidohydrolase